MISYLELSWSSLLISIAFLSILSDLQILFYLSHLLFHLLQHVGSKRNPVYRITPADWSVTWSTIEGFEGTHRQGCLVAIVVGELYKWQVVFPLPGLMHYMHYYHVFKYLIHSFCLSIGLRVIGSAKQQFGL